jgi:hypothetical protein
VVRIARVFPRITKATPRDELCFYDYPPLLGMPEFDEVHISVTFTYDIPKAEDLAEQWRYVGVPVKVGGPAYDDYTREFIPGRYLKEGYTITSAGCHNNCWFCSVPKRAGKLKELDIKDGYIIQDDNLLGCSKPHVRAVFEMLSRQKEKPIFSGGLEAKLLKPWHVELLQQVKPKEMFFAYDTPDDYEPLVEAGKLLKQAGYTLKSRKAFCYCLVGYDGDSKRKANRRLTNVLKAGFIPFAMLYKDVNGNENAEWKGFQRLWARPAIIVSRNKGLFQS